MGKNSFHKDILPLRHGMYRYALKLLRKEAEALDAVQDVLMRLWEKRDSLERIDNAEAFCMRSIRNQCLNMIKRNKRIISDEVLIDRDNGEMNPMQEAHSNQMVHEIKGCIDELTETQRSCLHLREIEGYSYREIADTLDLSLPQVKVKIYRGRKKVQEYLDEKSLIS